MRNVLVQPKDSRGYFMLPQAPEVRGSGVRLTTATIFT